MSKKFVPVCDKDRVWIDIETTGLDPLVHEIIEITVAYEPLPNGTPGPIYHAYIKPEHIETAEPRALEINGYSEEKWAAAGARSAQDVFGDFLFNAFLKNAVVAGQNVRFDMGFIMATYTRLGITPPDGLDRHLYDLSTLALEHLKPWLRSVSLPQIAKALGIKVDKEKLHGSCYDVELTMQCARKLQRAGWLKRLWWRMVVPRRLAEKPVRGTF